MTGDEIRKILDGCRSGDLSVDDGVERLRNLPFEDLGFANIDHHRSLRLGYPEVVFGAGKTDDEIVGIVAAMLKHDDNILVTRSNESSAARIRELAPDTRYHARSGAISLLKDTTVRGKGTVMVVSAGTSDLPVAQEALVTLEVMGNTVDSLFDVGVAGIHRLLDRKDRLTQASVLIVVAGMEGALPSVIGGLVAAPVIAVPTSVGYGASFGGVAALLGMLNSCAPNVTVVNIDNGYGAGVVASLINRL
jgi:NCAIR mutase (PurE)-related protein